MQQVLAREKEKSFQNEKNAGSLPDRISISFTETVHLPLPNPAFCLSEK